MTADTILLVKSVKNEICYAIEGNIVDRTSAKNGKGWCENVCPTLNTQDRHAIVIALDQQGGKGNCNYMEDIMPTLLSDSHGTPHGVCYSVDCRNLETNKELSATLQTKETGGWSLNYLNPVMYENTDSKQGKSCVSGVYAMITKQISMMIAEDLANTLVGTDYKEPQIICYEK